MKKWLQNSVYAYYRISGDASYDWAGKTVAELHPKKLLDVGCGDGSRLFRYLKEKPELFCGVEGFAPFAEEARKKGMEVRTFDLNGKWPYESNTFDCIHASQVIEHVHNTRQYLSETLRVMAPGGTMVMTSENLCSLLNLSAMLLGYTPFSLLAVGGWYLGNPFGLHAGEQVHGDLDISPDDPAFSGITGHNRVLSVPQTRDLMEKIGFSEIMSAREV